MENDQQSTVVPQWTYEDFKTLRLKKIYHGANALGIYELDTTDRSNTFLVCHGSLDFETGDVVAFGIEAPRNCSQRQAFEWGRMSWLEFWFHKDWIIELNISRMKKVVHSKLITPEQIDADSISLFKQYGTCGPYLLLRKQLRSALAIAIYKGEDAIKEEHEYLDFMSRHGHRLSVKAA